MRTKSPELKVKIFEFVNSFYRIEGRSPSFQEIGYGVGINKVQAYRYILEMSDEGTVNYENGIITSDVINKCSKKGMSAPIIGAVTCGDPTAEEENIEEYVSLPESIFGRGEFYILRAKGDSMIDAGIDPGNLVVIQKDISCKIGDIVVALDENGENTLKRYDGDNNGKPILSYMNESKYPGCTVEVGSFVCQGVLKHVIKSYN